MLVILIRQERKHTPVDQVRAVTLCRVFDGDICPAAQHLLAGCSLLTGGAVSRLHSEDRTSHADIAFAHLRVGLLDCLHHRLQLLESIQRTCACFDGFLCLLYFLGTSNISRILSGKCELCKAQRVGTVRGSLSGRDQLVRCRNRIMDLGNHFHDQVLRKRRHLRPVLDVWSELDLYVRICHAVAVKYSVCVNIAVEVILLSLVFHIHSCSRGQISFICSCCSNRTRIHQCYGSDLSALQLASLTVREVSGRMADRECVVGRCVSCTEAGSAEGGLHNSSCLKQICYRTILHQFHIYRHTCRIYAECKCI